MISMREFHNQFVQRHDFKYPDSDFLSNKYKHMLFKDIPEAWVPCIDEHLHYLNEILKVISIFQIYGFPVIHYENDINNHDFNIINRLEKNLLCIDSDLHKELDVSASESLVN